MSDYNEADHPRNPAGSPNGTGGEYADKTTIGDDTDLMPPAPPREDWEPDLADDDDANCDAFRRLDPFSMDEYYGAPLDRYVFLYRLYMDHPGSRETKWGLFKHFGEDRLRNDERWVYRTVDYDAIRRLNVIANTDDPDLIREASLHHNALVQEALWTNPHLTQADWDRSLDTCGRPGRFIALPMPFITGRASLEARERFARDHPERVTPDVAAITVGSTPSMRWHVDRWWREHHGHAAWSWGRIRVA